MIEGKNRRISMDILVLSDSHGRRDMVEEAIKIQIKKPDAIIYLGDGQRDIKNADTDDIPLYSVSGNCDSYGLFPDLSLPVEQNLILGEKRIFFTHGHKYGVKSTLTLLICEGAARGADIILFGHTHLPFEQVLMPESSYGIKTDKPIYIFNPGSIGMYPYSFGNITIDREGRVLTAHGSLK